VIDRELIEFVVFTQPLLDDEAWMRYFNVETPQEHLDFDLCKGRLEPLFNANLLRHPNLEASNVKATKVFFDSDVAKSEHSRLTFYLSQSDHADYLRRAGGVNLLHVPGNFLSDDILVLRWRGDERYFRRWEVPPTRIVSSSEAGLGTAVKPYTIYLGVNSNQKEVLETKQSAYRFVDIAIGERDTLASSGFAIIWLNPIVLNFAASNQELELSTKHSGETALNSSRANKSITTTWITQKECWLDIVPRVSSRLKPRIALLKHYARELAQSHSRSSVPKSTIETLLFKTTDSVCDWRPFFCLDLLGGEFHCEHDKSRGLLKSWRPVRQLTANEQWLARYLVDKWGGRIVEETEQYRVMAPRRQKHFRVFRPARPLHPDFKPRDIYCSIAKALNNLYGATSDFPEEGTELRLIRQHLLPVIQKCEWQGDPRRMLQSPHIYERAPGEFAFDETGFLEDFSREFFAPTSKVLLQIYSEGLGLHGSSRAVFNTRTEGLKMDLIASPFHGNRRLLVKFSRNLGKVKENALRLKNEHGWWEVWYESLFTHSEFVKYDFDPRTDSAELAQARLGHFQLGAKLKRYEQPPSVAV